MIYGERIRLRALERSDLELFVKWLNDPEVTRGLSHVAPLSFAAEENWFEGMLKRPIHEQPLMIDVHLGEEWLPVGDLGFSTIDWRVGSAEFGIVIGEKAYWDQGYGSEAIRLLLGHGFGTLRLNRICLRVYATNERARRAYQKIGFQEEGLMRQAEYREGRYLDVIWMSVLKSEWEGMYHAPSQP